MPWALFTEFSSACSLLFEKAEGIFVIASFVLFCLFYWEKLKICSSELHQFYLLEKPQNYSHLQKGSIIDGCNCYKCLHKIIALNQSANSF